MLIGKVLSSDSLRKDVDFLGVGRGEASEVAVKPKCKDTLLPHKSVREPEVQLVLTSTERERERESESTQSSTSHRPMRFCAVLPQNPEQILAHVTSESNEQNLALDHLPRSR